MLIYLVGGADVNKQWLKSLDHKNAIWVGVDRGTQTLLDAGIRVDRAFGDFDSVSAVELEFIRSVVQSVETANAEKNETDLELALNWAIEQQSDIKILGATGGRLDHFMGNLQLLSSEKALNYTRLIEIEDEQNRIRMLKAGKWKVENCEDFQYLSFIPMTNEVEGLSLTGVKYTLTNYNAVFGSTRTISNEIIEPIASISFSTGILMMVRSKDKS